MTKTIFPEEAGSMKRKQRNFSGTIGTASLLIILSFIICAPATARWGIKQHDVTDSSRDFVTDLFTDASECKRCHNNIADVNGEDISFVQSWETTMMRFSFLDPLWRAKVRSETLRNPDLATTIEKKCVRCHAPMASEQAIQNGDDVFIFYGGFVDEENPYHQAAMEGVGCTLCHQITSTSLLPPASFSGNFQIFDQPVAWGPFVPTYVNTMQRQSGYRPEYAEHIRKSEFCATCHELFTEYYDTTGHIVSTPETLFPEQTPYHEWLESSFSKKGIQCQNCHMTAAALTKITAIPRRAPQREGVLRHAFFTENTMMLSIIESVAQEIGLAIPDLNEAINDGETYLADAGSIEIETFSWDENDTLQVTLRIRNNAGHKLPTSIPLRRVFIHFAVYGKDGETIFSSGDTDAQGRIIGVDSDTDPSKYELHYNTISHENQVQVYEAIMANVDEEVTYTLLRASHFVKDNRILPQGFNKTNADRNIRPAGKAMEDTNFKGGEDRITYRIENVSESEVRIEAELKDQTLAYPMATNLFLDEENDPEGPIPFFRKKYEHYRTDFEIIHSTAQIIQR